MHREIEFRFHVGPRQRLALERLLFFNSCQARVAQGIVDAVEVFGPPEIVAEEDGLRVVSTRFVDAQCVFAVERETGKPVGVALFRKEGLSVTVLHLSIAAEYASGGLFSDEQLLLRLLREVKQSGSRIGGKLQLSYARHRTGLPRQVALS